MGNDGSNIGRKNPRHHSKRRKIFDLQKKALRMELSINGPARSVTMNCKQGMLAANSVVMGG